MYPQGSGSSQSEGSVSVEYARGSSDGQDVRGSSDGTSEAEATAKCQGRQHTQVHTGYGGNTPIRVDGSAGRHRQVRWSGADTARPNSLRFEDPMFVQMSSCAPLAPEQTKEARVPARNAVPQGHASIRTPTAAPLLDIELLASAVGMLSSQMKALEMQMRSEQRSFSATTEKEVAMWGHLNTLAAMSANSTCPRTVGEFYPPVMRNSSLL